MEPNSHKDRDIGGEIDACLFEHLSVFPDVYFSFTKGHN